MKQILLIISCFFILINGYSQYAPPAGQNGTTAIYKDSAIFQLWASECVVHRGWLDIADTLQGKVTYGVDTNAVGIADSHVVSLGDGGWAVLKFKHPIINDTGFDFAVFENALNDSFLELAFVEVSSDSIHFVRLPAVSLTDTTNQISSFGSIDATKIHNFAGKYRAGFGTPFDLDNVIDSANLDVNNIRFIKIVDVVGTINDSLCTRDSQGNKVNDPYPTAFISGGFDLDAVGAIHCNLQFIADIKNNENIYIYPNPVKQSEFFSVNIKNGKPLTFTIEIFNNLGQLFYIKKNIFSRIFNISTSGFKHGMYFINIELNGKIFRKKLVVL